MGAAVYGLVQHVFYLRNIGWALWLLLACASLVGRGELPAAAGRAGRLLVVVALLLVPVRALFVDTPSYAGNREFGFHEAERHPAGRFRWTEGRAARRLPWRGETLVLALANGHPLGGQRPAAVVVRIDGRTAAELEVAGGWEEHRFEVGPPQKDWLLLELEAGPTFRPFSDYLSVPDLAQSTDLRLLGVAIREAGWE